MDRSWETHSIELVELAKGGCSSALGELLERYRKYLKTLARVQIHQSLQGKGDASDIVQETFLRAHKAFGQFRGTTEAELVAWLRMILASRLASFVRTHTTQRRSVDLERHLNLELAQSSVALDQVLVQPGPSPSEAAAERERALLVASAIEDLPDDYRTVILLRHVRGLSYPEVSDAMSRSVDSVKKLWVRALAQLQRAMESMP